MNGLILKNSYSTISSQLKTIERIKEELENLGVNVDVKDTSFFPCIIDQSIINSIENLYDFVIYFDKDKYVARMLKDSNVRVFNDPNAIEICDDKMLTHIELAKHNIPQPKTIPGLLCYSEKSTISEESINRIISELGLPLVVKESYGSLGRNVYLVNDKKELIELSNKLMQTPHLYQQYIASSYGVDIRVVCVNAKPIAWMERRSTTDFRSNIELGGKGKNIELSDTFKALASKVAKALNLDYCGIDFLIGKDNEPLVCEVNSNAFFIELERITGVNVAKAYATHIVETTKK